VRVAGSALNHSAHGLTRNASPGYQYGSDNACYDTKNECRCLIPDPACKATNPRVMESPQ
jgi:hypothetical protein